MSVSTRARTPIHAHQTKSLTHATLQTRIVVMHAEQEWGGIGKFLFIRFTIPLVTLNALRRSSSGVVDRKRPWTRFHCIFISVLYESKDKLHLFYFINNLECTLNVAIGCRRADQQWSFQFGQYADWLTDWLPGGCLVDVCKCEQLQLTKQKTKIN